LLQPGISISFLLPYSNHTSLQVHVVHEAVLTLQTTCACAQSYPTFCDPMDCSLPDSSVHGIVQASILEWVAISPSGASSQPGDQTHILGGPHTAGGLFTTVLPGKPYRLQPTEATHHSPSDSQGLGPVCRALGNLMVPQLTVEW